MTILLLAQTAALLAVYAGGTAPMSTHDLGLVPCGVPFAAETVQPHEAPIELRWSDGSGTDCAADIATYTGTLPPRPLGYRVAVDTGAGFGPLSTAFLVAAAQDPTPGVCTESSQTALTVRRREMFVLRWCQPLVDDQGLPITIDELRVYRNGARLVPVPQMGAETPAGVPVSLTWFESASGTYAYTLRAVSNGLEGPDSLALTVTVQSGRPASAPRGQVTTE